MGAVVAGMFTGLLLGVVVIEPVTRLLAGDGGVAPAVGLLLAAGPPAVGAAAGLAVERRSRGRVG